MGRSSKSWTVALLTLLATAALARPKATASSTTFGAHDVASVFHIAKSSNDNQVHYGVRLDESCRPLGATPLYVYWREREQGPGVVSPLLKREQPAYGLAAQRVLTRKQTGGRVQAQLRALPERPIVIETFHDGSRCQARALTHIEGQPAKLDSVFVQLGSLWNVQSIEVRGRTLQDAREVQEVLSRE